MKKTRSKKQGRLIANGVILEKHEMATVVFLLGLGFNIELIRPSSMPNSKSPDLIMNNLTWEMKSPAGKGKYIIRDNIRIALRQSPNIIIDLRRIKLARQKALRDIQKYFSEMHQIQRLLVIIDNRTLDFKR